MKAEEPCEDKDRKRKSLIDEIKSFWNFLRSIYGILSLLTGLIAVFNPLIQIIPLKSAGTGTFGDPIGPGLVYFIPIQVTLLAVFITIFFILSAYIGRFKLIEIGEKKGRDALIRRYQNYFLIGCCMIISYMIVFYYISPLLLSVFLTLLNDILFLILYTAIFLLMTYAFTGLALIEYYKIGLQIDDT